MPTKGNSRRASSSPDHERPATPLYCAMPPTPSPKLPEGIAPERAEAILTLADKWVNGTALRYYFFDRESDAEDVVLADGSRRRVSWVGADDERVLVREAFEQWREIGIGLDFHEVSAREDAEIRIGFMRGDGAWSYVGTQILDRGPSQRTMNFGWDLTTARDGLDTALHEIGHTLGLPHEHQNPHAGIVWNEEAVYRALGGAPNFWSRDTTFHNIIRKIAPDRVQGSNWDPDSIMHYPFEAGLIARPDEYARGLQPHGGLSARDIAWVKSFYPPLDDAGMNELKPSQSAVLALRNGGQQNYLIEPTATRYYEMRTFGACDTIMVLFEDRSGIWSYLTADDDGGEDRNAHIRARLVKGRRYTLRVRLKYSDTSSIPAVMMW